MAESELSPEVKQQLEDLLKKNGIEPNQDILTVIIEQWNRAAGMELGSLTVEAQKMILALFLGTILLRVVKSIIRFNT